MRSFSALLVVFVFLMGCANDKVTPANRSTNNEQNASMKIEASINQSLPESCGFGALFYGKVTYHKLSKTTTLR